MADENMEESVAAEGLKRKHADIERQDPKLSQELTCHVEQSPSEDFGVTKLFYVFMFINSTFFISSLGPPIFIADNDESFNFYVSAT